MAIDNNLGAVVGAEEGAIESIQGNEGRIAQAWVNVRGGLRIFAVYFWHSEGWTSRNEALMEAVLKRTRITKHPWFIACDANMSPVDFEKSLWFRKDQVHVIAPEGVSTCRSKNAKGEWVEKVYDNVTACSSLKGRISDMKVIEDFQSRPDKAVTFAVERGKERLEWNEKKLPKASPGHSAGRLPGRSTEEKGREKEEECEEREQRQGKNEKIEEVIGGSQRMALEGQNPVQRWSSSQIENEEEEESWQEGDHMAEQWEEKPTFGRRCSKKKNGMKHFEVGCHTKKNRVGGN